MAKRLHYMPGRIVQREVLRAIDAHGKLTPTEILAFLGWPPQRMQTIRRAIAALRGEGILRLGGKQQGAGGPAQYWDRNRLARAR